MAEGFDEFWRHRFADSPPMGFILRRDLEERWVRFHSLPGSKRYAENESERRTILERANALAGEVFVPGEPCWLVVNDLVEKGAPWTPRAFLGIDCCPQPAFRSEEPNMTPYEDEWCTYAGPCTWRYGRFDELLTKIADNEEWAIIWVSQTSGAVFAPYDGGVDVIMPTVEAARELKRKHPEWQPNRSDGL